MTEAQVIGPAIPGGWLPRFTAFLFDGVVYLTFLFTIVYAIGFVSGLFVPKAIDTGAEAGVFEAIVVNLVLISLSAVQHSGVARNSFKHWRTPFIPRSIERSTHVLCASLGLLLLFWQWRPMPAVIWHIHEPDIAMIMATLSFVAWIIVFTSGGFLIGQSEPVEQRQVGIDRVGRRTRAGAFRVAFHRRCLRQPIYPGIIVALWAAPTMSAGHLLLAAAATAYIFIGIALEERSSAHSVTSSAVIGSTSRCCFHGASRTDPLSIVCKETEER
jgi:protein-S-isoprenylcysteine O-methyltransferase Ste14